MGASGTPGTRLPVPGFSDSLGSRVIVRESGSAVEMLRVTDDIASAPSFEAALRDGIGRLASFAHPSSGRVRRLEQVADGSGSFAVLSDYVEGNRLSEILLIAEHQRLPINTSATLDILRHVMSVVAGLHDHVLGGFHGVLGPERIVVRPDARVVVVEHVFGPALRRLPDRDPIDLWKQWRLAVPIDPALPRFGPRTDLVQIGVLALSLLLGRLIRPAEYPARLPELLAAATESDLVDNRRPLSPGLRSWVGAMLQIETEQRFRSMTGAREALDALMSDESQYIAAPIAVGTLLRPRHHRIRVVKKQPLAAAAVPQADEDRLASTPSALDELLACPTAPADVPAVTDVLLGSAEPAATVEAADRLIAVTEPTVAAQEAPPAPAPEPPPDSEPESPPIQPCASLPAAPMGVAAPMDVAALAATPAVDTETPWSQVALLPTERDLPFDLVQPRSDVVWPDAAPGAEAARYDQHRPIAVRIRAKTTVASRRAKPQWSKHGAVVTAVIAILLAASAGGVAMWWQSRKSAVGTGTLMVASEPPGSTVRVDGEPMGQTPLTLTLPAGRHEVEVRGFGDPRQATVGITAGEAASQVFTFDLPSTVGSLRVTSRAAGIEVLVDGQRRGVAPLTVSDLPLGIHTVMLRGPKGETRHEVTIEAAKTADLDTAETGWVKVQSPLNLQVSENGRAVGTVAGGPIPLIPGVHRLDFRNPDVSYQGSQVVQVAAGKTTRVAVDIPMGSVSFTSTPPSEVWVDGARVGDTPVTNLSLTLGPHDVAFRHPRLGEMRYDIKVTLASPVRMSVDFRK